MVEKFTYAEKAKWLVKMVNFHLEEARARFYLAQADLAAEKARKSTWEYQRDHDREETGSWGGMGAGYPFEHVIERVTKEENETKEKFENLKELYSFTLTEFLSKLPEPCESPNPLPNPPSP